jgi:hypothetical protein
MEKFIKVFDNILPKELEDKIESFVLDYNTLPHFPLYYLNNSTYSSSDPNFSLNPGLVNVFKGGDLNTPSDFLTQILYNFCCKNNIIVHEFLQGRVFVDLPSTKPGLDLPPHIDMNQNHWVLLYYINDSDGDTVLFEDDKETQIQRVSPKKGRMVFFDGSIPHCGSRSATNTRSAINFNFIGEKL